MARHRSLQALISLSVLGSFLGCGEVPTASPGIDGRRPSGSLEASGIAAARSTGGGATDVLPLEVTLDEAAGLKSDGAGAYLHGVDRVEAVLRANGNLNFDAASLTGKQKPIRLVRVRVTDDNTGAVVFEGVVDLFLSTHPRLTNDLVLRQMSVGQSGPTTGGARWPSADSTYILHYGRNCAGDSVIVANRMFATHPTTDLWTLAGLRGQLCRQPSKGSSPVVTVTDRASAAFNLTLRALSP